MKWVKDTENDYVNLNLVSYIFVETLEFSYRFPYRVIAAVSLSNEFKEFVLSEHKTEVEAREKLFRIISNSVSEV